LSTDSPATSSKNVDFTENVPLRYWAYSKNSPTQPKQINQLLNPSPRQLFKLGSGGAADEAAIAIRAIVK
jgi:hypothetical protein